MFRRMCYLTGAFSGAAMALSVLFWPFSKGHELFIGWTGKNHACSIAAIEGVARLSIEHRELVLDNPGLGWGKRETSQYWRMLLHPGHDIAGGALGDFSFYRSNTLARDWVRVAGAGRQYSRWDILMTVAVPLWFVAAVSTGMLITTLILLSRDRCRVLRGRCTNCGYDLRASKDRCPECGVLMK
jgi:hypothetical protein